MIPSTYVHLDSRTAIASSCKSGVVIGFPNRLHGFKSINNKSDTTSHESQRVSLSKFPMGRSVLLVVSISRASCYDILILVHA